MTMENEQEFEHPAQRRWWLLQKALECAPLENAIGLACQAEAFVTGVPGKNVLDASVPLAPVVVGLTGVARASAQPLHAEPTEPNSETRNVGPCALVAPTSPKPGKVALSPEQRDRLLQRFAGGAKNAELAAEFGLSMKQVQGVRMGSAREISRRREQSQVSEPTPDEFPKIASSADEVVRYLRQRDDVVVPQTDGGFLVNGRFRLDRAELLSRANRIRRRDGKPEFEVAGLVAAARNDPPLQPATPQIHI